MTTPTSAPTTTGTASSHSGASWVWLARITWRQHRWTVTATTLAVAAVSAYFLVTAARLDRISGCHGGLDCVGLWDSDGPVLGGRLHPLLGVLAFAGFVGVFWGAPQLAREYEQRTHLIAWTQDVPPTRWLLTRVLLLAAPITVFAATLCVTATAVAQQSLDHGSVAGHLPFGLGPQFTGAVDFELWPLLQVSYALFGFTLGVAASAVTRRLLPAMGLTLILFGAVRGGITALRPHYLPPARLITDVHSAGHGFPDGIYIANGYLHTSGATATFADLPQQVLDCEYANQPGPDGLDCFASHGWTRRFVDYQPLDRLTTFHLIETGIFLILAAALLTLAWHRVRKITTI
jgi:hypothetical protein